ncbi:hypothetical protein [Vibrio sp. MED222]|uniref:hypothetical protein n=1 Tax=Vibrio sp. MED222 TaxID=314290 RepID=UPI000068C396|nr:hypothetical protein [Vibrio sp. MED222]EAQ52319.1 hypothetical protein MED222_16601 [Vibrio sp. MED222]
MTTTNQRLHTIVEEQIQLTPSSKLVISKIAKIAGVSNATIHNRHPDVLAKISAHNANFLRASTRAKNIQLTKLKLEKKVLLEKISELEIQNRKLVSLNAVYELQLFKYKAEESN